jgi:hypothetical protein
MLADWTWQTEIGRGRASRERKRQLGRLGWQGLAGRDGFWMGRVGWLAGPSRARREREKEVGWRSGRWTGEGGLDSGWAELAGRLARLSRQLTGKGWNSQRRRNSQGRMDRG